MADLNLDIASLAAAYRSGATTPTAVAEALSLRIDGAPPELWIHRVPRDALVGAAHALEQRAANAGGSDALPLYGIPFAVKDNIDVAGLPTTAACPAFAHVAVTSAPVVRRLMEAGALLVGKTNMDQLATGLTGVRSPYGIPRNPFDARYVSGGSSSGSAGAVARGLASFALGTDTAGSGRVPAAFNNLVGVKPTGGLFSTTGVVPACRSLDCVSIFAFTVEDACRVAGLISGAAPGDPVDPLLRAGAARFDWSVAAAPQSFRFAIPDQAGREFFGDAEAERLFAGAVERWRHLGGDPVEIDFQPFRETARLLYDGPWIAERLAPFQELLRRPGALLPVIQEILSEGTRVTGVEVFAALGDLDRLRAQVRSLLAGVDFLLVPTTPTIYTIDEVNQRPRELNARLGLYTNFVNLQQLCALAVPNGFRVDGLPSGITLIGLPEQDARLAAFGAAHQRALAGPLGATGRTLQPAPAASPAPVGAQAAAELQVAVVGAHLSGQPLNHQLIELDGRLVRTCRTSSHYRLYALPGTVPPKPGLLRVGGESAGAAIEVEVWRLGRARFGEFFARVPAPLCLGTIELEDGSRVAGFLCEAHATAGARDISSFGGWRNFLASTRS
ncbi:MAG TPA: allophanate hydrolase, partial [Polyangia bacterium]|jgi:allophanate hydrolase|nr:allophanate hydrolase [Polyangia bacterium]